ncbi:MAG TPA: hypothetical protein VF337_09285, partial [Candidatus Limnocylindrales bacterium]
ARRSGSDLPSVVSPAGGAGDAAASGPSVVVAPVGGSASSGASAGDTSHSASGSQSDGSTAAVAAPSFVASGAPVFADASALTAAGAIGAASSRLSHAESVDGPRSAIGLADAADKLMSQVIGTIHTFETSAGPALEARISDPDLGDVRMVVTGRAGEIVQAQLVVRDRVTADAITAAAGRMRSGGDALAGVSVTVRTESGNSSMSNRSGGNAFESAAWGSGNGYAAGNGTGSNGGHGRGLGGGEANATGTAAGSSTGTGQGSAGHTGRDGQGTLARPETALQQDSARPNRPGSESSRSAGSGGEQGLQGDHRSDGDRRSLLDIRA